MAITELASRVLLKYVDRSHFLKIRNSYLKIRKASAPLIKFAYGTFDTKDLMSELEKQLDTPFDILMVHSSFNNMLPMYQGNALDLLKGLIQFCGPQRTLVMPAFYFGEPGAAGAYRTFVENPRFDLRKTPSQMGLITELFRRTKGVRQSSHPVYRVAALGPQAEELVAGQELSPTGMGEGTPFDFMAQHRTRIIGIGKTFQVMTQVHHVESLLGDDFPAPRSQSIPVRVAVVDKDETTFVDVGGSSIAAQFNIWKLRKILDRNQLQEWRFHNVPMFSAAADVVTDALVVAATRDKFVLYD